MRDKKVSSTTNDTKITQRRVREFEMHIVTVLQTSQKSKNSNMITINEEKEDAKII